MDDVFARYQKALRTGHQFAAEGRFKEALAEYEVAAGIADARALPHVCVGGMLLRLGKPRDALAAYERALEREPDDLDALTGRAAALLASGRREDAAAAKEQLQAEKAGPIEPAVPDALRTPLSRAETLAIAGEQARAAGRTQAAIEAWIAEANEHLTGERYDAALWMPPCVPCRWSRGSARVHLELTRIYRRRGWAAQATEHFAALRRLLELAPDASISAALDELSAQQG